jgi:activator of 2-hydroxyglutaryl-CoA dehydratase
VAKNSGVVKALENVLGTPLKIYVEPQIVGALGAAILALEKAS